MTYLLIALLLLCSFTVQAEEVLTESEVNATPSQITTEKFNAAAGRKMIEPPSAPKEVEIRQKLDIDPILRRFQEDAFSPETARDESKQVIFKEQRKERKHSVQEKNSGEQAKSIFRKLEGYCYFDRKIEMTTVSMPVDIPCSLEDVNEQAVLHGTLFADFKTYSLVLKPASVTIGTRELPVVAGYVMNGDRTSSNVATSVNKRYLRKVVSNMASRGVDNLLKAYQDYVQSKYTTTYTVGTEAPVVIQDRSNYPSNYPLISGVIGAIKGAAEAISGIVKSETGNVPVLFNIDQGTVVYVNLKVGEEK